jgi:hypothetical protein
VRPCYRVGFSVGTAPNIVQGSRVGNWHEPNATRGQQVASPWPAVCCVLYIGREEEIPGRHATMRTMFGCLSETATAWIVGLIDLPSGSSRECSHSLQSRPQQSGLLQSRYVSGTWRFRVRTFPTWIVAGDNVWSSTADFQIRHWAVSPIILTDVFRKFFFSFSQKFPGFYLVKPLQLQISYIKYHRALGRWISQILLTVKFYVYSAMTTKNVVFWNIKTQVVPHRRHITSPLQSPAG